MLVEIGGMLRFYNSISRLILLFRLDVLHYCTYVPQGILSHLPLMNAA